LRNKILPYFLGLVLVILLYGLVSRNTRLAKSDGDCETTESTTSRCKKLIEQIEHLTQSLPEKPESEAKDEDWDTWRARNYELLKKRIGLIEKLEKEKLSDEELKPYLEMKFDDIKTCFYYARGKANRFESKLYSVMDEGSPLAKTLATELFWSLNIYHVNTHLMRLSEADVQEIADFELSRKNQPEAGRLMATAVRMGRLKDDKVKWSTWVLENMPPESEGYKLVAARNKQTSDIGKQLEFKAEDINGNIIDSEKLKGKVVLLDFWAFWCGFCLAEMPDLNELHENYYDKGLRVIGVFNDYRFDQLKEYVEKNNIAWPQLVDYNANKSSFMHPLAQRYGFKALPRYMLVDKDGTLKKFGVRVEHLRPLLIELLEK